MIRAGAAALFTVVLSAAFAATIRSQPRLANALFVLDGVLAIAVIATAAILARRARETRDALGRALERAAELQQRSVTDEAACATWVADMTEWFKDTQRLLSEGLSRADAALFRDLSEGGSYLVPRAFNGEHRDYLNTLRKYTLNLKAIVERFLAGHK